MSVQMIGQLNEWSLLVTKHPEIAYIDSIKDIID